MTKDQEIAMLHATIEHLRADKHGLITALQLALTNRQEDAPEGRRSAGADRQRRYMARKQASPGVIKGVIKASFNDAEGDIGGGVPGTSGEDVLDDEERTGTPTTGKGSRGKPNVTEMTEVTLSDAQFDAFRQAYPKLTHRTNWGETRRRWNQLKPAEKAAVLVAVPNYAVTRDVLRNGEAGAQSWLNRRSWEQHQEPELALPPLSGNGTRPKNEPDYSGIVEWNRKQNELEAGQ